MNPERRFPHSFVELYGMRKLIVALILTLFSTSILADQVSLFLENDLIYNTDFSYTHGTRIEYYNVSNGVWIAVGQNIYTPLDKQATYLIKNDRPYAGYLYGSIFDTIYLKNGDEIYLEGEMGMTGPDSYAEETQIWVHEQFHNKIPQGWKNQIPNHFAVLLMGTYTTHIYTNSFFAIDPYAGIQAGNMADNINAGLSVYLGYNLPASRNQQRTIPFKAIMGNSWNPYGYLYCGIEPRYMMYNMMLEDHRFTIHPESFVYDQNLGAVLGCRYFEIAFTLCARSREFKEQSQAEKFGSLKLSVNF